MGFVLWLREIETLNSNFAVIAKGFVEGEDRHRELYRNWKLVFKNTKALKEA